MSWLLAHRARRFVRDSIWVAPALGMVTALVSTRLLMLVDRQLRWESGLDPESARALLSTLASSVFTLVVFVSSSLLLAIQLASSQLTPRIIAIVFRDPVTKGSLTAFVFTFTLSLGILVRVDGSVPAITGSVAACCFLGSLVLFLLLIDHLGKSLRPSGSCDRWPAKGAR
jgi:uncharacterized membrane protein